ncbi:PH domain-containing protein [Tsukamurella serpentis]
MAFPEKALIDDEQVLLHVRPHGRRMVGPVLMLFAACTAAGVALGLITRARLDGALPGWLGLAVLVVWAVVVCWWTVRPWLRHRASHLVLTDLRLMFRTGVARRRGIDLPLRRITSVQYHQRLVDRILRSGVLTVESAGEAPLDFHDVPRIAATHAMILDAMDDADEPGSWEYARRP